MNGDSISPKDISEVLYKFAKKSRDVFWIRSADYKQQIYVSAAYERIWGRDCQSLYESPEQWGAHLYPKDRERLKGSIRKRNEDILPGEKFFEWYRIMRPDGEIRWIEDESFPIFNEQNKLIGFAGIAQDVTENKLKEKELQQAKERAEIASQAKSHFIAGMSHDFRTSLNGILGMASILQQQALPKQMESIEGIIQAGNHLLRLVENILDYATVERGELPLLNESFNLYRLVKQAVAVIKILAEEKNINLIINCSDTVPKQVIGDSKRLYRILTNLLNNAIKFTTEGTIALTIDFLKQQNQFALFKITVKDSGMGIPQDKLDYIFERFTRIEAAYQSKYKGTGLGLTIVKRFVEDMKGSISVESQLGIGSTFSCIIPLQLQTEFSETKFVEVFDAPADLEAAVKTLALKTLLIEDDLLSQKVAAYLLTELNCQVDTADSCQQALKKLKSKIDYDLIITDISLPDGDGVLLTQQIRQFDADYYRQIPVIALTAHVSEFDKSHCLQAGMNGFLKKPLTYDEIINILYEIFPTKLRNE